ncbi:MAG: S-layer homology domain-containing protein [Betaproteobacteria bacterium]
MSAKTSRILAGLLIGLALSLPALAEAPKDVPPNHPAYRAIQTLIDQGYLSAFQDGSFRGDRPVDRYTLATVVARLLADIQSGKLVLPNEEMKTLRQLSTEFRAELVEVAGQVTAVAQAQEKTAGEVAVVREDVTRLMGELYQQQQALAGLQRDLQALQAKPDAATQAQVQAIAAKQESLRTSLQELQVEFQSYRRVSQQEMADLKVQNRNLMIGGAMLALLLLFGR